MMAPRASKRAFASPLVVSHDGQLMAPGGRRAFVEADLFNFWFFAGSWICFNVHFYTSVYRNAHKIRSVTPHTALPVQRLTAHDVLGAGESSSS